jgi:hypothetical protein
MGARSFTRAPIALPASIGAELRVSPFWREGALTKAAGARPWRLSQLAHSVALITAAAKPPHDVDSVPYVRASGAGKTVHALRLILVPRENQYYL